MAARQHGRQRRRRGDRAATVAAGRSTTRPTTPSSTPLRPAATRSWSAPGPRGPRATARPTSRSSLVSRRGEVPERLRDAPAGLLSCSPRPPRHPGSRRPHELLGDDGVLVVGRRPGRAGRGCGTTLVDRGFGSILCEGGPSLLGDLLGGGRRRRAVPHRRPGASSVATPGASCTARRPGVDLDLPAAPGERRHPPRAAGSSAALTPWPTVRIRHQGLESDGSPAEGARRSGASRAAAPRPPRGTGPGCRRRSGRGRRR